MANFFYRYTFKAVLFFIAAYCCLALQPAHAQIIWSSTTGSAWTTGSNWTGGVVPTATQVAQFNANPTSATTGVGINMDTASGAIAAGAIYVSPARTNNLLVGNSSPTTPGTLTLTGATVNGTPNTVIANFAANASRLTVQNTQGSGASTMVLNIGSGSKNITAGAAGSSITVGNTISIANSITGSATLNFLGNGTWDATTSTGVSGGLLRLGGTNTFTSGITAGLSDGTSSGILELDSADAIGNTAGNNITINNNSQLYLAAPTGTSYNNSNILLTISGNGTNYTTTGKGAITNLSGSSYTWNSNINMPADAAINVQGVAVTSVTVTGNISGAGELVKVGIGNLILSGTANSWTGGTQVTNGKLTVNAGSGISTGPLEMYQQVNNPSIVFNNAEQTISALSSSFTGASNNNSVVLNGTRLTINQNTNTTYGGSTASLASTISGTGSVVKTGTGILTLTSAANTFSGGLKITAGTIRYNPASGTAVTNASPDTLNGGTLSTSGINRPFTFTFGTLALTDNSTVDLGTDTLHSIRFTGSSAITWTTGKILTVTNWEGTWNSTAGTRGKIFIGASASGATAAQLAQIKFIDGSGNIFNATQLTTGEVVPATPVITTIAATYGAFCNNIDNFISVGFTTSGPVTGTYFVQLSGPSGAFTNDFVTGIIGTGTSSPITATIPNGTPAGTGYRVRVINQLPVSIFGSNNGSNIVVNGIPVLPAITGSTIVPLGGAVTWANATTGGTWASNNPAIASVNTTTGVITGIATGTTTITYSYTNFCGFTGTTTATITVVPIPSILTVSPQSGTPGTTVTITGSNFNPVASNNIVYFGTVQAVVITAAATSLTVTVPANAGYAPITVTDITTGLSASAQYAFTPTYNNTGLMPDSVNFKPRVNFTTGAIPVGACVGDLDGDGKPDMVVINSGPNNMYVYRNTSVAGIINSASFATPVTYTTGLGPHYARIADLDGDGKPEIIVANTSTSTNKISVFKNTSTTGNISFAARVDFGAVAAPIDLAVADFDSDGRPDLAVIVQNSNKVIVYHNNSTTGVINASSFGGAMTFNTGIFPFKIYTGDLDGDNKPDIAFTNYLSNTVTALHNSCPLGTITNTSFSTATTLSTGLSPTGIAGGDIDGDGKPELTVTNSAENTISIFRNINTISGTMAFAPAIAYATDSIPEDVVLADVDGDHKIDIAIGNYGAASVSIFHNNSTPGSINAASLSSRKNFGTGLSPAGIVFTDVDGDGKPDVVIANGDESSVSVLKNYPLPRVGNIVGNDSICVGTNTTLTNSIAGGTWVSGNTAIATISAAGTVYAVASGIDTIYYYTVAQGDTNTASFVLTVESPNTVGPIMAASNTVCTGAAISLTDAALGGIWTSSTPSVATVDANGFVTGISVGNAIITYAISTSCGSSSDTILVTVTPGTGYVIGAITGPSAVCAGSTAMLSDTSAGGTWSLSSMYVTLLGPGVLIGISSGTTTVSYSINNACGTYLATYVVTTDTTLVADSIYSPSAICVGASATLTNAAGTGGAWTTSNANATINTAGVLTGVSAGAVNITYTITNACATSQGIKSITINPLPFAGSITGGNTVCPGDTLALTNTTAGGVWSVSNANATALANGKIRGVTGGIDTVRYIVSNSCGADTASKVITVLPAPFAGVITGAATLCPGSSITLRDTVAGGIWSSLNGNATVADSIVTGVTPGTDTIRYTVTNSCGTAVAIKKVTINPVTPVDTIVGPSSVCTGASISLTNATDSGTWSKTNARANVSATGVVTGISAGIDTIKYTPRGTCPMVAMKAITIKSTPSAGIITGAGSVCVGAAITLRDTVAGGIWSATNVHSLLTDTVLTGISAGTDTVHYTITSECGLTTVFKRITINPLPYADEITGGSSIFVGNIITLKDSTSGGTWSVSGSNAIITANGRLGGLKEGIDTVKYTITNVCGTAVARLPITVLSSANAGSIADIQLYPNPSTGKFTIKLTSLVNESVSLVIANAAYQVIQVASVNTNEPTDMNFDMADGVYFLSAMSSKGWFTVRFVIAK